MSADFPGHKTRRTTLKLYRNNGNGTFTDVTSKIGLDVEMHGTGVAVSDYDNGGWNDLYVTGLGEARLFHNEHRRFKDVTQAAGVNNAGFGASAAWVDYNRDGIGAEVRVHSVAGENWQTVHSGSSYCSQSELTLTFGLGKESEAQSAEITWPSGQKDILRNLNADATYTIEEGGKILATRPFKRRL